jgi:hypothetical protein
LREFINADALDRLQGGRRLLLLPFDMVVVPACQGAFRNPVKGRDIGDVGEVKQTCDVSEEAFGGMSAWGDPWVRGSEKPLTTLTFVLGRADDEFDRLITQGKILDRLGVMTPVYGVAGVMTVRANTYLLGGNEREADRVFRRLTMFVNDSEPGEVQRYCPGCQPLIRAHNSPDTRSLP